jgi:hypothetical protein
MLNLPLRYPGPKEALFHGALSLLRPAISEATTATVSAPQATATADATTAAAAMPDAGAQPPEPPVDTLMKDADDIISPAADAAPAIVWETSGNDETGGSHAPAQSEGLGMSSAAWKAQNQGNPRKAVMVGGVAVPTDSPEKEKPAAAVAGLSSADATAASAQEQPKKEEEDDAFTGRNTKVSSDVSVFRLQWTFIQSLLMCATCHQMLQG